MITSSEAVSLAIFLISKTATIVLLIIRRCDNGCFSNRIQGALRMWLVHCIAGGGQPRLCPIQPPLPPRVYADYVVYRCVFFPYPCRVSTGPVWLSGPNCTGDELHILRCHWNASPCTAACTHNDDVTVQCSKWEGEEEEGNMYITRSCGDYIIPRKLGGGGGGGGMWK